MFPKKPLKAVILLAPKYLSSDAPEKEKTSFTLSENIENLAKSAEKVVFFHSKDDFVVDYKNLDIFKKAVPNAEYITFTDKNHFLQESFQELVDEIKKLAR